LLAGTALSPALGSKAAPAASAGLSDASIAEQSAAQSNVSFLVATGILLIPTFPLIKTRQLGLCDETTVNLDRRKYKH
jgi:hypothetical protein